MARLVHFQTLNGFKVAINPTQVISVIENKEKEVEICTTVRDAIYLVKGRYLDVVQRLSR